jgi:putative membrane protein
MRFGEADKSAIEARVAAFEQASGAQAVVSVVDRCDAYPEVPWRAFALGAALAALFVWAVPVSGALLYHSTALALTAVLGSGAAAALLTVFVPASGRWLLPRARRAAELRQYAQALFLERELFATRERSALLILVGRYERCGAVLADRGLRERLPAGQLAQAEARLNAALASVGIAAAVLQTLDVLQAGLGRCPAGGDNELADSVIREREH